MNTFEHYRSRLDDVRRAQTVLDYPEGPDEHPDYDEFGEDGPQALSVERETVYRIVLGTGGPHDEVRVTVNEHDEVTGGVYAYYHRGTDAHGEYNLSADEAQEWADAFYLGEDVR